MYSKLRCNTELQTSEERARCESIIEDVYVGKKKRKKKEGEQEGEMNITGKGIWVLIIYSSPSPPTTWKPSTLGPGGAVESKSNTRKKGRNEEPCG